MAVTPKVPLGASTTNRKWWVDVDSSDMSAAATYIGVYGIQEFKDNVEPTSQDDSDFDGDGWKSETVTALLGKLEFKVGRKTLASDGQAYDPGAVVLPAASVLADARGQAAQPS